MSNMCYIARLRRRQIDEGWSERRMAQELDVGLATWLRIANGQQDPTVPFLRSAMKRFPEYDPWVLSFIRGDVQTENDYVPDKHTESVPSTGR